MFQITFNAPNKYANKCRKERQNRGKIKHKNIIIYIRRHSLLGKIIQNIVKEFFIYFSFLEISLTCFVYV